MAVLSGAAGRVVCCAGKLVSGRLRIVAGEQVASALVRAEAGVEGGVDGAVGVDVVPLSGGAVLRPHADGAVAVGLAVRLGAVAAEPGDLAVGEVRAADAVEEAGDEDEPACFD